MVKDAEFALFSATKLLWQRRLVVLPNPASS